MGQGVGLVLCVCLVQAIQAISLTGVLSNGTVPQILGDLSFANSGSAGVELTVTTSIQKGTLRTYLVFSTTAPDLTQLDTLASYVLVHDAGIDVTGQIVDKTTKVPLCNGESRVFFVVQVADQTDASVILDAVTDTPHDKSCAQLEDGTSDVSTLSNGGIISYQVLGFTTADLSTSKLLFLSLNSTSASIAFDTGSPPFAPGFDSSSRLVSGVFAEPSPILASSNTSLPIAASEGFTTYCFAQCRSGQTYDLFKGPDCVFFSSADADKVMFSDLRFGVFVASATPVTFNLTVNTADASGLCIGSAPRDEVRDSLGQQVFEAWLIGAPALVVLVILAVICTRSRTISPTEEDQKNVNRIRRTSLTQMLSSYDRDISEQSSERSHED